MRFRPLPELGAVRSKEIAIGAAPNGRRFAELRVAERRKASVLNDKTLGNAAVRPAPRRCDIPNRTPFRSKNSGNELDDMTSPSSKDNQSQARRIAIQQLQSFSRAGLELIPKPSGKYRFEQLSPSADASEISADHETPVSTATAPERVAGTDRVAEAKPTIQSERNVPTTVLGYQSEKLDSSGRFQQLAIAKQEVSQCTMCSELAACRKNTVFGVGSPNARLCFLGEGPGADEDRQGEPFVGAAGQLLDKILTACKLSRDEVYILNTVKCRPPGNRNPEDSELENCWPYAVRQLEILQPEFICCLGSVAAKTLLQTTQSIGRMRGQFFDYRGSRVVVTYHPAYLLRNPAAKRQVWDDMKMLLSAMGRESI